MVSGDNGAKSDDDLLDDHDCLNPTPLSQQEVSYECC